VGRFERMDGYILVGYPLSGAQKEMLKELGLVRVLRHLDKPYCEVINALLDKYFAVVVVNDPRCTSQLHRVWEEHPYRVFTFEYDVKVSGRSRQLDADIVIKKGEWWYSYRAIRLVLLEEFEYVYSAV